MPLLDAFNGNQKRLLNVFRWSVQRLIVLLPLFEIFFNCQIHDYAFYAFSDLRGASGAGKSLTLGPAIPDKGYNE